MRVSGHTLIGEGAPHDADGQRVNIYHPLWASPGSPRLGCGKCSCGEIGPWTESGKARQRWHREHKAAVAADLSEVPGV